MNWLTTIAAVEVPPALRARPRDGRGYLVPWIVWTDRTGKPHFQINDERKARSCINKRVCALCGRRIWPDDGFWFVGGRRCFTHPQGAFVDPPAHEACARYALRVCPFLAAPSYARRIDERTVKPDVMPADALLAKDTAMPDARPELFGLGCTGGYDVLPVAPGQVYLRARGWRSIEYWRHGERVEVEAAA